MTRPISDDARLVAAYIRYAETLDTGKQRTTDGESAAYETIHKLITHGPAEHAWRLVIDILREAPDDKLGVYATGLLESLVARWGDVLVLEIEREAARDERFRWALGVIWLTELGFSRTPEEREALERIVAASGGRTKVAEWVQNPHR